MRAFRVALQLLAGLAAPSQKNGVSVDYAEIEGDGGDQDGWQKIGQMSDKIREFLSK